MDNVNDFGSLIRKVVSKWFTLTDQFFEELDGEYIPEDVIELLHNMESQVYGNEGEFKAALNMAIELLRKYTQVSLEDVAYLVQRLSSVWFILTAQFFEKLKSIIIPENILNLLRTMENKVYKSEEEFENALKNIMGEENSKPYQPVILKQALVSVEDKAWEGAWEHFLRGEYVKVIYKCIKDCTNSPQNSTMRQDIFQEVMALLLADHRKVLRRIRNPEKKAFKTWLRMVTLHLIFKIVPSKNRLTSIDDILEILDISFSLDEEILRRQLDEIITLYLEPQEQLIIHFLLEGLTLEQIKDLMGQSLGSVFNLKNRAVEKIKKYINNDEKKSE